MEDELDKDSIKVYMAWYAGDSPWGYDNWKDEKYATKKVELKRASDWSHGNLVYRSDPNDANAFIPPQMAGPNGYQIVQYRIWAEYSNMNGMPQDDAVLSDNDWDIPGWYYGITDFNKVNGAFSAYTVLDSISPKRAWFNEINTFDGDLMDSTRQFIEVAVPQGFDMTGWAVQYIKDDGRYDANTAAMFGHDGVPAFKTADAHNSYSFIALQSPQTKASGSYSGVNDGTWKSSAFQNGVVNVASPYALRLVRPTGIIEHEVVFMSTNTSTSGNSFLFEGENLLDNLNKKLPPPKDSDGWIYAGKENWAGSLGVFRSHGENSSCWTNTLVRTHQTPGKVNRLPDGSLQTIDPDYFEPPSGTNLWIYANVADGSLNSLQMVIGDVTNTSAVIIVPQGADGTFSTSIVYVVKKWFELDSVVTNEYGKTGAAVPEAPGRRGTWTLDLSGLKMSDPESRKFEITASTKDSSNIPSAANGGIDKSDPYYPAVVDWLQNYDEGPIKFAEFWGMDNVKRGSPLNLKQMYWLDIPPVGSEGPWDTSDWVFKGGMAAGARPDCQFDTVVDGYVTNIRVAVTMMVTNRYDNSCRGVNMLRGLEPGSTSADYDEKTSSHSWTSVTFKITGALQNGTVDKWYRPLRWFTLGLDSFTEANGYTRYIDVLDPFSKASMGYSYDWHNYPGSSVWYRWRIDHDTNRPPDTVYQLNDENALFGTNSAPSLISYP